MSQALYITNYEYCRSNYPSLKYQKCKPLGCKDIEIRQFEFVPKTQFLQSCNTN